MSTATGSRPPVLIFGAHLAALGVLRILARHGIQAYVVDDTTNVIVHSRWYRPAERTLAETSDSNVLAGYLRSLELPTAVLIACSDRWALAVSGLPPDVRERFPASIAPHESIERFVDKDRFREDLLADRRNRFFNAYMAKAKEKMRIELNREAVQRIVG